RAALRAVGIGGEARRAARAFDTRVTAAQLRALIAIANSGSFTIAAHELDLAQPTVHRAARNLEELAGIPFFTATAIGVELTAAAQAFVLAAKLAQAEIRQGIEEIARETGEDRATLVIGSLPLARTTIVPRAVDAMVRAVPNAQIRVIEGRYPQLLRSLREGDIDCLIGALRLPAPADDVTEEPLFDDDLAIVAHPGHPLFAKPDLAIEDTLAYPWVAPPRETPAGSWLFDTLRIEDRPVTPVRVVASSLVFLRGLLAQGDYLSVISRHQISLEEAAGHIAPLPLALENGTRSIGLTCRSGWRPTETQARFIDLLRETACGGLAETPPPPGAS
ncbi:LysR family transcriptional regulator, partial [Aquicoccus sp. SCR17]|nr:LysR family transcriptional regulator [Carideicomes alvinocaridis]